MILSRYNRFRQVGRIFFGRLAEYFSASRHFALKSSVKSNFCEGFLRLYAKILRRTVEVLTAVIRRNLYGRYLNARIWRELPLPCGFSMREFGAVGTGGAPVPPGSIAQRLTAENNANIKTTRFMKNCVVCLLPFACILAHSRFKHRGGQTGRHGSAARTDCSFFSLSKPNGNSRSFFFSPRKFGGKLYGPHPVPPESIAQRHLVCPSD